VDPEVDPTRNQQRVLVDVDPLPMEPRGEVRSLREEVMLDQEIKRNPAPAVQTRSGVVVPADDEDGLGTSARVSPPPAKSVRRPETGPASGLHFTRRFF